MDQNSNIIEGNENINQIKQIEVIFSRKQSKEENYQMDHSVSNSPNPLNNEKQIKNNKRKNPEQKSIKDYFKNPTCKFEFNKIFVENDFLNRNLSIQLIKDTILPLFKIFGSYKKSTKSKNLPLKSPISDYDWSKISEKLRNFCIENKDPISKKAKVNSQLFDKLSNLILDFYLKDNFRPSTTNQSKSFISKNFSKKRTMNSKNLQQKSITNKRPFTTYLKEGTKDMSMLNESAKPKIILNIENPDSMIDLPLLKSHDQVINRGSKTCEKEYHEYVHIITRYLKYFIKGGDSPNPFNIITINFNVLNSLYKEITETYDGHELYKSIHQHIIDICYKNKQIESTFFLGITLKTYNESIIPFINDKEEKSNELSLNIECKSLDNCLLKINDIQKQFNDLLSNDSIFNLIFFEAPRGINLFDIPVFGNELSIVFEFPNKNSMQYKKLNVIFFLVTESDGLKGCTMTLYVNNLESISNFFDQYLLKHQSKRYSLKLAKIGRKDFLEFNISDSISKKLVFIELINDCDISEDEFVLAEAYESENECRSIIYQKEIIEKQKKNLTLEFLQSENCISELKYFLEKNSSRIYPGFQNLGNTCYMNTALQSIARCRPIIYIFLCLKYESLIVKGKGKDNEYSDLIGSFAELMKEVYNKNEKWYNPQNVKSSVDALLPNFRGKSQKDSISFLVAYLRKIHEGMNKKIKPEYKILDKYSEGDENLKFLERENTFKLIDDSIIEDIFSIYTKSYKICQNCFFASPNFDKINNLPLNYFEKYEAHTFKLTIIDLENTDTPLIINVNIPWKTTYFELSNTLMSYFNINNRSFIFCILKKNAKSYSTLFFPRDPYNTISFNITNETDKMVAYSIESLDQKDPGKIILEILIKDKDRNSILEFPLFYHFPLASTIEDLLNKLKLKFNIESMPQIKFIDYTYKDKEINYFEHMKECDKSTCICIINEYEIKESLSNIIKKFKQRFYYTLEFSCVNISNLAEIENLNKKFIEKSPVLEKELLIPLKPERSNVKNRSVMELIDLFHLEEFQLEDEPTYSCINCNQKVFVLSSISLYYLPEVFIINLLKVGDISYNQGKYDSYSYMENYMEIPEKITLKSRSRDGSKLIDVEYELFALGCHSGSFEGGHYKARCRIPFSDNWITCDDSSVNSFNSKFPLQCNKSKVLYYQKVISNN